MGARWDDGQGGYCRWGYVPTRVVSLLPEPAQAAAVRFYRRHLTRFTPRCPRPGESCSALAARIGLAAALPQIMLCGRCADEPTPGRHARGRIL